VATSETVYDAYWSSGLHCTAEWTEEVCQRVLGPLLGRAKVLDYGCGVGAAYQRRLASAVGEYIAADVSNVALETARSRGFQAMKISDTDSTINAPNGSFSGAICSEVLEHLFDPLAAIREIHRLIEPGGALVVTVPNFGYHPWRLMALLRAQVPSEPEDPKHNRYNGVHIRYFSTLTLRRLLNDGGFSHVTLTSFDISSIWDVFYAGGPLAAISEWAQRSLPQAFHLRFLENIWPTVFAKRLCAIGYKLV
jgi:2-polyprenyl-3-methyl-5-hydroxy-6-metoxy-1,4-benzoquinol methylase